MVDEKGDILGTDYQALLDQLDGKTPPPKQSVTQTIMEVDNTYLPLRLFCSFQILQKEKGHLLQGMKASPDASLLNHLKSRYAQCDQVLKTLSKAAASGSLTLKSYLDKNNANFAELLANFKVVK